MKRGLQFLLSLHFAKMSLHLKIMSTKTMHAILRRQGEDIEVEIIGKMWRPHQDGITPQSLRSFKEYEIKQIAKDCLEGDTQNLCYWTDVIDPEAFGSKRSGII